MTPRIFDPLALFPIRVKDKLVTAKTLKEGMSSYNPEKAEALIPIGDTAYERTLRLHEALHVIYSRDRVPHTILGQTVEDLRLHLNKAKLEGQPRRDEITAAVRDLRSIKFAPTHMLYSYSDEVLGVFLRSVAILKGHSGWTPNSKAQAYSKLIKEAYEKLEGVKHKAKLGQSLKRAFKHISQTDTIAEAANILRHHLTHPDHPPQASNPQSGPANSQTGEALPNPLMAGKLEMGDGTDSWMQGFGDGEFAKIELPDEVRSKGGVIPKEAHDRLVRLSKSNLIPPVRMHRFALTHPKKNDKGPITVATFSGARIKAKRLAAAMTSPIPIRLFERKRIETEGGVGGTILIDASGSMGIETSNLEELLKLCPMGSIAYYDGVCSGEDYRSVKEGGDIVVISERGKQCDIDACKKFFPLRNGENQIDLQAMQWMMTQPRPWWFLTDGHFTGSCNYVAKQLLYGLIQKGLVTQVTSLAHMKRILADKQEELEAVRTRRTRYKVDQI